MRKQLAFALLAIVLVPAVHAAYTSTVAGTTATMTGNSSGGVGDIVVFSASGGLLVHNRGLLDAGFNSAFDFDSTVAGDQTLAASAATTINLVSGLGPDAIDVGGSFSSFSAPADQLFAAFNINNSNDPDKTLDVDNSLSLNSTTFLITSVAVTAPGINVLRSGSAGFSNVAVIGGSGDDTFNVQTVASSVVGVEPLSIFPNGGTNSVTIATLGNLNGFDQTIHVFGSANNTALTINDSANAAGRTATITATNFTSPSVTGTFEWDANALSALTVNFGTGSDNVTVSSSPANATNTVNGGDGTDTFAVTVASLGANSVNVLNGGNADDTFNVTPGAASGAQITINGDAPTTPPGDVLNYLGAGGFIVGNEIRALGTTFVRFNSIETINGAGPFITLATIDPTYAESGGAQMLTLTLSGPLATPVSVDVTRTGGTATPGADFSTAFPLTVTFPANTTSTTFTFTPVNDAVNEPNETVALALANPSANATIGSPSTTTITITSDDFGASDVPTLSQIALALFGLLLVAAALRKL